MPTAPWGPTTAEVLKALTATHTDLNDLTPLGVALHHLTDVLRVDTTVRGVTLHRVTTALTRDVRAVLHRTDVLEAIARTVTDPDRPAFLHGPSIEELTGASWAAISERARTRSEATIGAADDYGVDAVLRLAALRGTEPDLPWWGTRRWEQIVEGCDRITACTDAQRQLLASSPDAVDDALLGRLLAEN